MLFVAKFRRVARYGVAVFLAAVSCFSAFGDIRCTAGDPYQASDGSWYLPITCGGEVSGSQDVLIDGYVEGSGNCSNCIKMTVQECEAHKAYLLEFSSSLRDSIIEVHQKVGSIHNKALLSLSITKSLQEEGSEFVKPEGNMGRENVNAVSIADYPQSVFYPLDEATTSASRYRGAAYNGIYNYYNQAVVPNLGELNTNLEAIKDQSAELMTGIDSIINDLSPVTNYVSSITCIQCTSGGGGGGGGGSSDTCPCAQVLNAIKNLLEEKRDILKKWDEDEVPALQTKLDKIVSYLKVIQDAVAPIGTNFIHAVELTNLNGVEIKMNELDKLLHDQTSGAFKQNEYAKLSWFTRVEYLLGTIAGVFTVTNRDSDLTSSVVSGAYDDIKNEKDSLQAKVDRVESNFDSVSQSFKNFYSAFNSSFVGAGNSSSSFTLYASWFGGRGLTVNIDSSVTQSARAVTSLLWTIMFTVIMYNFILYGVKYFAFVLKIWLSQITQFVK